MLDSAIVKKNKVSLSDYNYRRDIENRLLMAQFSTLDLAVLEEILFSSLTISIAKLASNIGESVETIQPVLEKLSQPGLFKFDRDSIVVDKEMRKYYESQLAKFDEDFKPDMEFLQSLLRKVPINVLPLWYAVPRTSNNIFDSLVERYLATPQIFQRYLMELNTGDPILSAIAQDVYRAPNFQMTAKELCNKYSLSREQFEENMLHLEFQFVCCLGYKKENNQWVEVVTPFHEWREYLFFLRNTTAKPVPNPSKIVRLRPNEFSFVQDIAQLLKIALKDPLPLTEKGYATLRAKGADFYNDVPYIERLLRKIRLLKLGEIENNTLHPLAFAHEWIEMRPENRAIYLYRHAANRITSIEAPAELSSDKVLREAEKSITRVLHTGWVFFDDFMKGVFVPLQENTHVSLKKTGKSWSYALPTYSPNEQAFIKAVIFEWLFEVGITAIGTYEGKDCFCVTPLGQSLFG
jgi:hypothetical protein